MNSSKYISLIRDTVLDDMITSGVDLKTMVFMQDNASCHKSKKTSRWFADSNITLGFHPAQSPDLNPIEFVWGWLKKRVNKRQGEIINKDDLLRVIVDEASKVNPATIRKHFSALPARLKKMKKHDFDTI
ncbi:TCB1 [Enterospora canceri]|uniref:TCB1 n=1 Tax=Enterospora canceri TaxID=1081671 RepID=A0A1Y1S4K2_9MICR|nr:TCB1 [Enterospora canceri]